MSADIIESILTYFGKDKSYFNVSDVICSWRVLFLTFLSLVLIDVYIVQPQSYDNFLCSFVYYERKVQKQGPP